MSLKEHFWEVGAAGASVLGIVAFVVVPLWYEHSRLHAEAAGDGSVITLTGVAATGTWTEDSVNGVNYWNRTFRSARPVATAGKRVTLRLKSADVIHTFYCPELGLGPRDVWPGHVEELEFTPSSPGRYTYYCTTLCGDAHFGMRGEIAVIAQGTTPPPELPEHEGYWKEKAPPRGATKVEYGKWLFHKNGCFRCHGEEGKGGVHNPNYLKDTVPALNTIAERMKLDDRADADAIVAQLEKGAPLESLSDKPPVRRFNVVLAQYDALREVIRKGSPSGMKDPAGPKPPLEMPAWGQRLSDSDIDALLAYLLTQQPWEDQEK